MKKDLKSGSRAGHELFQIELEPHQPDTVLPAGGGQIEQPRGVELS
jgi:hypothetical protein